MSSLLSGLLAGGWPFLVGWVFPTILAVVAFDVLIEVNNHKLPLISLLQLSATGQAIVIVVAAFGIPLLLSALQTQLYRILEGYYFPTQLQVARQNHHRRQRDAVAKKLDTVAKKLDAAAGSMNTVTTSSRDAVGQALRYGLLLERLRRYPIDNSQIAPTRLGNAIRAFEVYGSHRFCIDSQVLWYELIGVAPEKTRADLERARAGVDFFVALVYLSTLGGAACIIMSFLQGKPTLGLIIGGIIALCLAPGWYEFAVRSTDDWYQAMQALVNLGRKPLAESLNLTLPGTLEAEREMWKRVGWLINLEYNSQISELLQPFSGAALKNIPELDGERPRGDQQLQAPTGGTAANGIINQ
jgi:hypothetical protein